jgi:hypothetical protein
MKTPLTATSKGAQGEMKKSQKSLKKPLTNPQTPCYNKGTKGEANTTNAERHTL